MDTFNKLVSKHALSALLGHIRAYVIQVDKNGNALAGNAAFEKARASLEEENISEWFVESERESVRSRIEAGVLSRWTGVLLSNHPFGEGQADCLLIPIPGGGAMFILERIETDAALVERLKEQSRLYQAESEAAKKVALNKQTEVDSIMAQAQEMSYVDPLTFLPNRRLIVRELQNELARAESLKTALSISIVDVDHFKKVNDTYGHTTGDHVLRHVAYQLRDHIRHPDVAGRYGGEEFLILLPRTDIDSASEQAGRLCKEVREMALQVNNKTLNVTISVGIAQYRHGEDTWETLLHRADGALYEAKKKGRDRWVAAE